MAYDLSVHWNDVQKGVDDEGTATTAVHGRSHSQGLKSTRVQIAPKIEGSHYVSRLVFLPARAADDLPVTINGKLAGKSRWGSAGADEWNVKGGKDGMVKTVTVDMRLNHPLVIAAAEQAKPNTATQYEREDAMIANAPETADGKNEVRAWIAEQKDKPDYWPGDPIPDCPIHK